MTARSTAVLLGSLSLLPLLLGEVSCSEAASFVVDSTTDAVDALPGDGACATLASECTLRAAVQEANALAGADDVTLPAGTYVLTLPGHEDAAMAGDLDVRDALTIAGAGAASTVVDGGGVNGVFQVHMVALALSGVTVQHGEAEASQGGGINAASATLSLSNCVVTANHAFIGGGIAAFANPTIIATTVSDNSADLTAGGLAVVSGTIRDSTFAGNTVAPSSSIGGRDIVTNGAGTLDIRNSTIEDEIRNLAICMPGLCTAGTDIVLANVTVGTLSFLNAGPGGSFTARNSIIRRLEWALISQGYNIIQSANGPISGDTTGNLVGVDPMLAPLADNGGPTATHQLLPGSLARNAANPAAPGSGGTACEALDQRGVARPIGPRCDIGSLESRCGDGVAQPEEDCDDGNPTNGDGCDVNCTVSACGNGVVAPGEQCDDGNTAAGDCCDPSCQFEAASTACASDGRPCTDDVCDGSGACTHPANTAPCSDGDPCTQGDRCSEGFCLSGAGCDPCLTCDPFAGCVMPSCSLEPATRALLTVRRGTTDARDKLGYRWQGGPLAKEDFPDPRSVTPRFCVYDGAGGVLLSALAPNLSCAGGDCWTELGNGYRYRDPALDPDGILSMRLGAGNVGKVKLKGRGANLGLAGLPFPNGVRVRVFANLDGTCFGVDFATPVTSTSSEFRARLP